MAAARLLAADAPPPGAAATGIADPGDSRDRPSARCLACHWLASAQGPHAQGRHHLRLGRGHQQRRRQDGTVGPRRCASWAIARSRPTRSTYDRNSNDIRATGQVRYRDPMVRLQGTRATTAMWAPSSHAPVPVSAAARTRQRRGHLDGTRQCRDAAARDLHQLPAAAHRLGSAARELRLDTDAGRGVGRGARVDFEGMPDPVPAVHLVSAQHCAPERLSVSHSSAAPACTASSSACPGTGTSRRIRTRPSRRRYYSSRGLNTGAEYRFLTEATRGTLNVNYMPHDRATGGERSFVRLHRSATSCRLEHAHPDRHRECQRRRIFRGLHPGHRKHQHAVPAAQRRGHAPRRHLGSARRRGWAFRPSITTTCRSTSAPTCSCRA